MLKVIGNAYGDSREKMDMIVAALQDAGLVVGYNNLANIVIMENIVEEETKETKEE